LKSNGIQQRYYAIDQQQNTTYSNSLMAALAVRNALSQINLEPSAIDLLACATSWPDLLLPGFASMVHGELAVTYAWLSDRQAWGTDISALLRAGKLTEVLQLLSGTWTSLGYGIETNSMSSKLPGIYQKLLQEELAEILPTQSSPQNQL
jgi:predicted naringenin-chalcone synthase